MYHTASLLLINSASAPQSGFGIDNPEYQQFILIKQNLIYFYIHRISLYNFVKIKIVIAKKATISFMITFMITFVY